jgi:hypothetical protein
MNKNTIADIGEILLMSIVGTVLSLPIGLVTGLVLNCIVRLGVIV